MADYTHSLSLKLGSTERFASTIAGTAESPSWVECYNDGTTCHSSP